MINNGLMSKRGDSDKQIMTIYYETHVIEALWKEPQKSLHHGGNSWAEKELPT